MENVTIDPGFKRPIDNRVLHPSIWLDEMAHDQISIMEKIREFILAEKFLEATTILETQKHYWSGIRDGNRFLRNPFKQEIEKI